MTEPKQEVAELRMSPRQAIKHAVEAYEKGHYRAAQRLADWAFDQGLDESQMDWYAKFMELLEVVDPVLDLGPDPGDR